MKFTAAVVLAAASGAMAHYAAGNVTYTTEVVTEYTTYCPEPTTITHGDKTYTVTEATTLTITDCPCTISKPVITTSHVECKTCPTHTPPVYNTTTLVPTHSTGGVIPTYPTAVPTAGAAKTVLSGAALAGLLGFAALL